MPQNQPNGSNWNHDFEPYLMYDAIYDNNEKRVSKLNHSAKLNKNEHTKYLYLESLRI